VLDLAGEMMPFAKIDPAALFVYFDDSRPALGMKMVDQVDHHVLSFSKAARPSLTPPTILPGGSFGNRDLFLLRKAVIRPVFDFSRLRTGPAPDQVSGTIIFARDGVFMRAWPFGSQTTQDVELNTGRIGASFAHPDGMWVDDWEIVLISGATKETVLGRRGKPVQ
jgi:hypothetical protein